jgi:hypothetical protein
MRSYDTTRGSNVTLTASVWPPAPRWSHTLSYVGSAASPPVNPTRVRRTPGSAAKCASGFQYHPIPKKAVSSRAASSRERGEASAATADRERGGTRRRKSATRDAPRRGAGETRIEAERARM